MKIYNDDGTQVTCISKALVRDTRLTWQARGLFGYMASIAKKNVVQTSINKLTKESPKGRGATTSALHELERFGYVQMIIRRANDQQLTRYYKYILHNQPKTSRSDVFKGSLND